jgi:hypothetical protein
MRAYGVQAYKDEYESIGKAAQPESVPAVNKEDDGKNCEYVFQHPVRRVPRFIGPDQPPDRKEKKQFCSVFNL